MAAGVGIDANPAAAHDERRISGYGSIADNHEKVRLVRRILPSLRAAAVDGVLAMPDFYLLMEHVSDTGVITLSLRARLP